MGWLCEWRVTCDQCSARGPLRRLSADAEKAAAKRGWLTWEGFYGSFHACPECRKALSADLAASLAESNEVRGGTEEVA